MCYGVSKGSAFGLLLTVTRKFAFLHRRLVLRISGSPGNRIGLGLRQIDYEEEVAR